MKVSFKERVASLFNPHSGKNTPRYGFGKIVADILSGPRYSYSTSTLEELRLAARQICIKQPEIVNITGGDGTQSLYLTALIKEYESKGQPLPKFMVTPGGTRNVLALNLGITNMSGWDYVHRIQHKVERGLPLDTVQLNPLKINGSYGFMYGAGLVAQGVELYYAGAPYQCEDAVRDYGFAEALNAEKLPCRFSCRADKAERYGGWCPKCGKKLRRRLGDRRALEVAAEVFWDELKSKLLFRKSRELITKPVYAEISLTGHEEPFAPFLTHTGIFCSTLEYMGRGFRAMPDARKEPNNFMLRTINLSFWGLARNLPFLWSGLPLPTKQCFDAVVPALTIKYKSPTVRQIDGDLNKDDPSQVDRLEAGPLLTFVVG